jgi:putative copper export protein
MLPVSAETFRLFLHVLAATVWVGGQLTLVALLPVLRSLSPDAPRLAARRFSVVAWSAFAVLVATGIWNILATDPVWSSAYGTTLLVKLLVVALSGVAAFAHGIARSKAGLAIWGALALLGALGALFLGILLTG